MESTKNAERVESKAGDTRRRNQERREAKRHELNQIKEGIRHAMVGIINDPESTNEEEKDIFDLRFSICNIIRGVRHENKRK